MNELVQLKSKMMQAIIDPNRGNIIMSCKMFNNEWIYMDAENYYSLERPRCGCPVLFPYMGALDNDELQINHEIYSTGIHGIVHTNTWELLEKKEDYALLATFSDKSSLKKFPYQFELA